MGDQTTFFVSKEDKKALKPMAVDRDLIIFGFVLDELNTFRVHLNELGIYEDDKDDFLEHLFDAHDKDRVEVYVTFGRAITITSSSLRGIERFSVRARKFDIVRVK